MFKKICFLAEQKVLECIQFCFEGFKPGVFGQQGV